MGKSSFVGLQIQIRSWNGSAVFTLSLRLGASFNIELKGQIITPAALFAIASSYVPLTLVLSWRLSLDLDVSMRINLGPFFNEIV